MKGTGVVARVVIVLRRTVKLAMMKSKGVRYCNGQETGAETISVFFHQH